MPAVSGGYLGAGKRRRVPVRQSPPKARRAPVRPRPEVSVLSKPQTVRKAPTRTVFQKPIGAVSPVGQGRSVAGRQKRQAANRLPAEHQLPRFPVLRHYTEPQRKFIIQQTTASLKKVAAQRGIPGHQVVNAVYSAGDHHTRQTLRTFARAYRETRQVGEAKALTGFARQNPGVQGVLRELGPLNTAQKARAYRYITKPLPSEARPGPKPAGTLKRAAGLYADVVTSGGPALYVQSKLGQKTSERFHTQLASAGVPDSIAGNVLRDAVDLPAQAIPSAIYSVNHPVAAAKGYLKSDPLALALQGKIKEAREAARQHPGVAALEVVSAGRAADSAAGFVSRGFRRDPGVRFTQQVPGTNITREVPNPKGYVAGKLARRSDAASARRVENMRKGARTEARKGNFEEARRLRDLAARDDRGRLPESDIQRRVDEFQPQAETRRRQDAARVDEALPKLEGKGTEAAVQVRVQAISKASKADINSLIGELDHQADHGNLTRPQLAANRELRTRLENYTAGDVPASTVDALAKQYADVVNPISRQLIERGMLSTDSAKYVPYAVRNAGFRHSAERLRSPEYIAHLDAKAAAGKATREERRILRQYETARRKSLKQQYVAQHAVRPIEVFDPRASRKAIARHERRRVDRPFIREGEVQDFQKGAKYSDILYHVTDPETAKVVARTGLDPAKAQRGTYGLGVYSASRPEVIPGATSTVKVAVRMRNPLIIDADKAMTALKPYRDAAVAKVGKEDLRALSAEMTRGLQKAGYDGVVVKGAMNGGDYVANFHPQDVRVVSDRGVARRGGRTSAVIERKLPAAKETRTVREPRRGTVPTEAGVRPRKALLRLQKVRSNEELLRNQLREAQANAAAARKAASESKPPQGSRYRPAGFAPPEVAPRLERMNQLRDEARSFREQAVEAKTAGDAAAAERFRTQAVYREKVANAIREEVERLPAPRLTGSELVDAVTDFMVKGGYAPEDIAFVTQAPGLNSAGAYFIDFTQRRGIGGPHRTGEATLTGSFDSKEGILRENGRRLQSLLSADENFTAFIREFGLRNGQDLSTFRNAGEARDAARAMMFDADGNEIAGAYEWSVIRVNPWLGRREALQALLDDVNAEGLAQGIADSKGGNAIVEAIQDALDTSALADDAAGEFALIPSAASQRMLQHTKILGPSDGLKVFRFLNSAFRRTVLATSVPWITGNIVEGLLRAGIERAGPNSLRRMNLVLDALERIDPAARRELERRAFGGGQAHLAQAGNIYTAADQFRNSNKALRQVAVAAAALRRAPGFKQVGDFWKAYTDWVFHSVNHGIESRIQTAMGGRALFPEFGTLSKTAIEDAARGLTNTNNQVKLARAVQRAYGKYDAFGPTGRQFIMLYTPFVAWSLNALKFLGDVLPKDHPALTAALAASYSASKEWREDQGMSYFVDGALPGFLQGSYPTSKGPVRASRFTPFGIASDLPGNFASLVLPQYHGALMSLEGLDWKGQRLKDDNGASINDPLKLMFIATREFAYSSVPIANQINRFIAGGGDPKALLDIINPVKPVSSGNGPSGGASGGFPSPAFGGSGGSQRSSGSAGGGFPAPAFK